MNLTIKIIIGVVAGSIISYSIILIINMQITKMETKAFIDQMEVITKNTHKSISQIIPQHPQQKEKPKPIWISGKPLKECMGSSKEINERILKCRNGYWINENTKNQKVKLEKQRQRKMAATNKATKTCQYWNEQLKKEKTHETIKNQRESCALKMEMINTPLSSF